MMSYYQTNFAMMQHHNYSLSDLDSMLPWEREVYVALLADYIKQVEQENKQ